MIKVGSKVKCLNTIRFIDGTFHITGQVYIVQENTLAYYEVNHKEYQLLDEEWFNLLPEEIAKKAFFNLEEQKMKSRDSKIGALSSALSVAFNWTHSPEQFHYWYELFIEIDKQEEEQESGSNEFVYNFDTFNN